MNEEDLKQLKTIMQDVMQKELIPVKSDLDEMRTGFGTELNEIRTDLNEVRIDLHDVKTDLNEVRADVNNVRTDLNEVRADLNNVRTDLNNVRTDVSEIKKNQRQLSKDITVSLGEYHDRLEKHIDRRTEALNKRVFNIETEMTSR